MPRQNNEPKTLRRSLPLYSDLGFTARQESRGYAHAQQIDAPHPGLVFDKFIDTWDIGQGECAIQDPESKNVTDKRKLGSKRAWLEETKALVKQYETQLGIKLGKAITRQKKLIDALGGEWFEVKTDWRFVSGLGNGHPFETGFIWHHTLGVPYLPGSSVKGLMRAWVDPKIDEKGQIRGWGDKETWEKIKRLFGDTEYDGAGALIIFDALPTQVPEIDLDIMNPHYGEYYTDPRTPPADYLSPTPIFFLMVKERQRFLFGLALRPSARNLETGDLARGACLLREALAHLGSGGKTAVGYGTMQVDREEEEKRRQEQKQKREENARRQAQAERKAYLATLSPERQRVEQLRADASVPGVSAMMDKRDALLQAIANLLKQAAKWPNREDREEAAKLIEEVYGRLGWGNENKARERREALQRLRQQPN